VQLLNGGKVVSEVLTDAQGRFRLEAPPGRLVLRAINAGAYRSTASVPVDLSQARTVTMSLQLDTGIR
jgi:hypothetical protein